MNRLRRAVAGLLFMTGAAHAADVAVLSAGAVEPGLKPVLAVFERESGHHVTLNFATAPQIRERVASGAAQPDLVIAPSAVLDELGAAAKVDTAARISIGRVGIGIAVRPGGVRPDLTSADTLKRALLEADAVVYNRASTGLYVEGLIKRWGLTDVLQPKTVRFADGASVMEHVLHGSGNQIGLGAMTEILLLKERGLVLVGPLPAEVQNVTHYEAAPALHGAAAPSDAVRSLLERLASPAARRTLDDAGIAGTR
jgi:molybdate transport system substrate-binding protein